MVLLLVCMGTGLAGMRGSCLFWYQPELLVAGLLHRTVSRPRVKWNQYSFLRATDLSGSLWMAHCTDGHALCCAVFFVCCICNCLMELCTVMQHRALLVLPDEKW